MKKMIIKIGGMSCQHCTKAVEHALKGLNGVHWVKVDLAKANATVEYDENEFSIGAAETAIQEQGYDFLGAKDC